MANLLVHSSMLPLTPCCAEDAAPTFPGAAQEGQITNDKDKLPGMMRYLTYEQVKMLLSSLQASYQVSLEFDCRPGLKFLVQKVAQLKSAANLYKQAGAAWSIQAIALFDLCLIRLETGKVKADDVKRALENQQRHKNSISDVEDKEGEAKEVSAIDLLDDNNRHFVELHNLFLEVCEHYADVILDKEGRNTRLDELSKQQLYFLTVEPDDFHQMVFSSKSRGGSVSNIDPVIEEEPKQLEEEEVGNSKDIGAEEKEGEKPPPASPSANKPFHFSDFASAQPPSPTPSSPNVSDDDKSSTGRGAAEEMRRTRLESGSNSILEGAKSTVVDEDDNGDEEVFRVATTSEMDGMMSEYRSRKGRRTMPSSSVDTPTSAGSNASRKNPFLAKANSGTTSKGESSNANKEGVDPEIAGQHRASMLADSEARTAVWTELVSGVLDLSASLPEERMRPMLPALFPGVRALTACAADEGLKRRVADFFQRVADIYGFNPEG